MHRKFLMNTIFADLFTRCTYYRQWLANWLSDHCSSIKASQTNKQGRNHQPANHCLQTSGLTCDTGLSEMLTAMSGPLFHFHCSFFPPLVYSSHSASFTEQAAAFDPGEDALLILRCNGRGTCIHPWITILLTHQSTLVDPKQNGEIWSWFIKSMKSFSFVVCFQTLIIIERIAPKRHTMERLLYLRGKK